MGKVFIPKATPIIEGKLYQRGQFDKFDVETKHRLFAAYGIDIVVSMFGDYDSDLPGMLYHYIYRPIPDGKSADVYYDELVDIAYEVAGCIEDGHCALSHCHGGRNRAGLMNALIVRELLGISGAKALLVVERARPNAIATISFREFLQSLM